MKKNTTVNTFGFYISILLVILTLITFTIAINTPPISGSFCIGPCIEYPYTDIVSRFPADYIWMYFAIVLTAVYVAFIACIHQYASSDNRLFSLIGLSFALISATILISDYFIQLAVIQPSIIMDETEGIAILTQYNPHGLFIALEEIGYIMMSASFLCLAPVFISGGIEGVVRWIFILSFGLTIGSLIYITATFGINRGDLFEVVVISIDWLVLLLTGILLSIIFKRAMTSTQK